MRGSRAIPRAAVAGTALAVLAVTDAAALAAPKQTGRLRIEAVSSAPDLVTGGNSLLAIKVPGGVKPSRVRILRNGHDITGVFEPQPDNAKRLVGLVNGLREGANLISARLRGANRASTLTLFNSPIKGPLFSGPQQTPFICTTQAAGLGPATGSDCSAPTQVEYRYRSTSGDFKPLADPSQRPSDLAQTTTRDGQTVDYVVRIESGVINRSIYRWAILAPGGQIGPGWNGRLMYSFGGGCNAGYQQGSSGPGTVLDDRALSRGYSVISSSLTVLGTACNDVLSAETVEMVKEHVIESLGRPPAWTIGQGSSGGSVQIQMIAQNYPGLLNGLLPGASFPDSSAPDYPDCRLLNAYYATPDGSALSGAQREAISGLSNPNGCVALGAGADVVHASEGCDESVVPMSLIFDPATNPGGARCTIWDSMVNVYGRDPETGYARRTLDNVGVQYGLAALRQGDITPDQFLDLNEQIDGYDDNGNIVSRRSVADQKALAIAYRTGRINQGAGGVPDVPIIDARTYVDDQVNVHQYLNTYRFRARLLRTNGTYANQVMFRAAGGPNVKAMNDTAIDLMGNWLDSIQADRSTRPLSEKVIADRPAGAVDACWANGGQRTDGAAVIGSNNFCENTYPPHSLPAQQAGRPVDSLVAKCRLKPVDLNDYPALTPAQQSRLRSIFADGVCDWSKPGVAEQPVGHSWQEFGPARTIKARARRLELGTKPAKPRRGHTVKLTARLKPCPEVKWQRIAFERRRRGKWRPSATKIAKGRECSAVVHLRARHAIEVRARAKPIQGYRGARSKTKHL